MWNLLKWFAGLVATGSAEDLIYSGTGDGGADSRLLRTPFSICWSSLTEIAWSCEHIYDLNHKKNRLLLLLSHKSESDKVKKSHWVLKKGFGVSWLALPHRPAGQIASSGPSPHLFPPQGGWVEEAASKHTSSVPSELKRSQCPDEQLTSGRSASTVLPISLWERSSQEWRRYSAVFWYRLSDTHRAPAFFSENIRTRKSASWWGWKVVGTSR